MRITEAAILTLLSDAAQKACEMAGVDPLKNMNVVELHDAFSAEELAAYEMIGICKKGDGVAFSRSGNTALGGRCPVNLSGGLLSLEHPLVASGLRVCNNITQQLWGEAGEVQVKNAGVGMAAMLGGVLTGQKSLYAEQYPLPVYGSGPVEVRIYSDYLCQACQRLEPALEPVF